MPYLHKQHRHLIKFLPCPKKVLLRYSNLFSNLNSSKQRHSSCFIIKGLIIPRHILLSDNRPPTPSPLPRENVTKTHQGALLPKEFWSVLENSFGSRTVLFWWDFSSDRNMWRGMINPDYNNYIFKFVIDFTSQNIWLLHILANQGGRIT